MKIMKHVLQPNCHLQIQQFKRKPEYEHPTVRTASFADGIGRMYKYKKQSTRMKAIAGKRIEA